MLSHACYAQSDVRYLHRSNHGRVDPLDPRCQQDAPCRVDEEFTGVFFLSLGLLIVLLLFKRVERQVALPLLCEATVLSCLVFADIKKRYTPKQLMQMIYTTEPKRS